MCSDKIIHVRGRRNEKKALLSITSSVHSNQPFAGPHDHVQPVEWMLAQLKLLLLGLHVKKYRVSHKSLRTFSFAQRLVGHTVCTYA